MCKLEPWGDSTGGNAVLCLPHEADFDAMTPTQRENTFDRNFVTGCLERLQNNCPGADLYFLRINCKTIAGIVAARTAKEKEA